MNFQIRHVRPNEDLEAVHAILTCRHVIEGTMRLPHQPLDYTRKRLEPVDGVIRLVAHDDSHLFGYCELITYPDIPRHNHVGEINMIATHEDFRGRGVGQALFAAMVDLGDNWLNLTRLALVVWTTNEAAVRLYEKNGFAIEGTMPAYATRQGEYIDAYMMGRVKRTG